MMKIIIIVIGIILSMIAPTHSTSNPPEENIINIPYGIMSRTTLYMVMQYLDLDDLKKLSCCNRRLCALNNDSQIISQSTHHLTIHNQQELDNINKFLSCKYTFELNDWIPTEHKKNRTKFPYAKYKIVLKHNTFNHSEEELIKANNDIYISSLNIIENPNVTNEILKQDFLSNFKYLTSLVLIWSNIDTPKVAIIASALKQNCSICDLNLRGNKIQSSDAKVLADAITHNTNLTSLCLSYNEIRCMGAIAIASAINNYLKLLDLENNLIGNDGAAALATAMITNTTLTSLNLGSNSLNPTNSGLFLEIIKQNKTLKELKLPFSHIRPVSTELINAINNNFSLISLDLCAVGLFPEDIGTIKKGITNSKVKVAL